MGSLLCGNLEEKLEERSSARNSIRTDIPAQKKCMTRAKQKRRKKTIHSWKGAWPRLEHWRKDLETLTVELKQPRVIDLVPIDFVSGEPVEREGKPTKRLRGQLIFFTNADLTLRRPSGAILVVDRYEVVAISDGKTRFEPR